MSRLRDDKVLDLYMEQVCKYDPVGPEEERRLVQAMKNGDTSAREKLILHNQRFVVFIAKRYMGRGVSFLDLISEGNIGLMKGLEKYEFGHDTNVCSYAIYWMRKAMWRLVLKQGRDIRIPSTAHKALRDLGKVELNLIERFGREPTREEIAAEMKIPVAKVEKILKATIPHVGLDSPIESTDGSYSRHDRIEDESMQTASELAGSIDLHGRIRELVDSLPAKKADIMRRRFGFNGEKPQTLEEIGKSYGVTREYIRQIQNRVLLQFRKKLRLRSALDQPKVSM